MIKHKKVLIAFDGSRDSLKALDTAKCIFGNTDTELNVVYVHDESNDQTINIGLSSSGQDYLYHPDVSSGMVADPIMLHEEKVISSPDEMPDRVMAMAKSKLADSKLVTYEHLIGKPDKRIVEHAKNSGVDLIVIGNRGIGALKKLVTGSVSQKVVNNSECSVFIVK